LYCDVASPRPGSAVLARYEAIFENMYVKTSASNTPIFVTMRSRTSTGSLCRREQISSRALFLCVAGFLGVLPLFLLPISQPMYGESAPSTTLPRSPTAPPRRFLLLSTPILASYCAVSLWVCRTAVISPFSKGLKKPETARKMALYRGVEAILFDVTSVKRKHVNRLAVKELERRNLVKKDDLVILTKGVNMGVNGGTNAMKIFSVGDVP